MMKYEENLSDFQGMNLLMTETLTVRLDDAGDGDGALGLGFRNETEVPLTVTLHDMSFGDNVVMVKLGGESIECRERIDLEVEGKASLKLPPISRIETRIPCAVQLNLDVSGENRERGNSYILRIFVDPDYDSVSAEAEETRYLDADELEDGGTDEENKERRGIREISYNAVRTGISESGFREILERNKAEEREILHAMADFYISTDEPDKAVYNLKRLAGMGDNEAVYRLAMLYIGYSEYDKAYEMIRRLKKACMPEGYYLQGVIYAYGPEDRRDRKAALKALEKCIRIADQSGMCTEMYAAAYKGCADCRIDLYTNDLKELERAKEEYLCSAKFGGTPQEGRIEYIDRTVKEITCKRYRFKRKVLICCMVTVVLLIAGIVANTLTKNFYSDTEEMTIYTVGTCGQQVEEDVS